MRPDYKGFAQVEIGCRAFGSSLPEVGMLRLWLSFAGRSSVLAQHDSGDQKNVGSATVTLNPRSQPHLPGSVVGEASMRQGEETGKITEVIVLW